MNVPLLDLKAQYRTIRAEVEEAMREVMESQHFILGPKVEECEARVAEYCGTRHAIGVSSGTDALLLCLMAEGIGPGDEVITTPYTFFATAGCVSRLGATPVFVDIDPVSYNLDAGAIEARVTSRTKAIIPVHLFGQSADMRAVMEVAARHRLVVIEDAAQAIGAEHEMGRCGAIGHYGCLSFFPSKNLGAAGDGGMVITTDAGRAEKIRVLRAHGSQPKYYHRMIGGNFRLDALQAAVVTAKLGHLDTWTKRRNENADRYDHLFAESGLNAMDGMAWARGGDRRAGPDEDVHVILPSVVTPRHVFNQYVVRVPHRDAVRSALQKRGIGTEVYYPVPMHLQECFAALGHKRGDFPESERAADSTLALPIYPELSDEQAAWVVRSVEECVLRALGRDGAAT
jgi:dTDP-4-amino-4,6-dideoxygalactose transaminase